MSTRDDELEAILREFKPGSPASPVPEALKSAAAESVEPDPVMPAERRPVPAAKGVNKLPGFIAFIFILITLAAFAWIGLNIHPDSDHAADSTALRNMDLMKSLDVFTNNSKSDALGGLAYIKKKYTIPETDLVAPRPDSTKFGSTTDPDVIQSVIDSAAELLDGESVSWDSSVELFPGSEVQYYLDETIFVLCWKEIGESNVRTCAEVKIADGSQLRRKIAGDSYGSGVQEYASDMAKQTNAVVAINGDFYAFRNAGITAYQRRLYRAGFDDKLDTCFFTASGEMLFTRTGRFATEAEAEQYISDNDVTFAISFGPILVDNGELQYTPYYRIGEVDAYYPRAAIGSLGERHYLLMTVNIEGSCYNVADINQLARYMYEKNCRQAYTLDGGQTAVIVFNGSAVNRVSYGYERTMSDIIYFATAIPSEE